MMARTKKRPIAGWMGCALIVVVAATTVVQARQLASKPAPEWTAAEWIPWLERPDRVARLNVDAIVSSLGLQPGNVVADIGAGAGAFEPALAKAVSPGGKVYANEIAPAFLEHIRMRMKEKRIDNVVTVLGKAADPNLPSKDVDVVLIHVVLHHIADRVGFLKSTATYLKPSGRIAVIDVLPIGPDRDQQERFVSKAQVKAWMGAAGLKPIREFDFLLPDKWFLLFGKGGD